MQGVEVVVSPSDPGRARVTYTPEVHGLRDMVRPFLSKYIFNIDFFTENCRLQQGNAVQGYHLYVCYHIRSRFFETSRSGSD